MLGDSLPLFFPVLIFSLVLWLIPNKVDKYCNRLSPKGARNGKIIYRALPIIMTLYLVIYRSRAIMSRDLGETEVAKRLGQTEASFADLQLLFTGDGLGEIALLFLLSFSLWTRYLPSLKASSSELKVMISNRVMIYVAACALLSFWVFFPESNYYSTDSLPLEPTMSASGDYNLLMVIIGILIIAFSGELFAISTFHYLDEGIKTLQFRASIKMYVVCGVMLLGFYSSDYFTIDWVVDNGFDKVKMALIFLSQGLILTFICAPSQQFDDALKVGDGRSRSFAIMATCATLLIIMVTSLLLRTSTVFDEGNRYLHEAFWLAASVMILISMTQILPRYGFDAAARPEYWWLRMMLVLAPAVILIFNPLAIFLIPSLWIVACFSIILPTTIEIDVKSPNRQQSIALFGFTVTLSAGLILSSNAVSNFLLFGPLMLIISYGLMKLHISTTN